MSIRIKFIIDKSSLNEVEEELNTMIKRVIRNTMKEYEYNEPNKTKINSLIDTLIEKGIIERCDVS